MSSGALLLGGVLAIALDEVVDRTRSLDKLPLIKAQWLDHNETTPHAHALTSLVLFQGSTVAKVYAPGLLPRALYWVAFQAPFPYISNVHALWAAAYRRNLAGMLTEYWYGQRMTAGVLGVDQIDGRLALVSEFVDATKPRIVTRPRRSWSTCAAASRRRDSRPGRSIRASRAPSTTCLQVADGSFRIVDLESGLVSPLASLKTWKRAIDRQMVPFFDDIFFDILRSYLAREEANMVAAKGDAWVAELRELVDDAETQVVKWHASELRLWNRALGLRGERVRNSNRGRQRSRALVRWQREGDELGRCRRHPLGDRGPPDAPTKPSNCASRSRSPTSRR